MNKVTRGEVRSRADYEKIRDEFRASVMAQKEDRRVHLEPHFTLLFENHDTVLYQIQEMMRAEGIDGEAEIDHEIETYNELLGDEGELGVTLLIEIDEAGERERLLSRWRGLPESFYIEMRDGRRVAPEVDQRQVGEERISSVHYMKFRVGDGVPVRVGCMHPDIDGGVKLSQRQAAMLASDLITSAAKSEKTN